MLYIIKLLNYACNFILIVTLRLIFCMFYLYLRVAVSINLHVKRECGPAVSAVLVLAV